MTTEMLLLEPPGVAEARQEFEACEMCQKYGLRFYSMRARFESTDAYSAIGSSYGMTRWVTRYLDVRYFRKLRTIKSARRQTRAHVRMKENISRLETLLPNESPLQLVAQSARSAGCKVEILPRLGTNPPEPATKIVGINGHICSVLFSTPSVTLPRVWISRKTAAAVNAHILVLLDQKTHERCIYVVPATIVWHIRFEGKDTKDTTIASPSSSENKPTCNYTDLCLRGYKNAWWVVGQLTKPRAK